MKDELILGSARVSVTSKALALGSKSYTSVSANSSSTALSSGVLTANGTGLASAVGAHTTAKVTVAGNASLVIKTIKSRLSKNSATASGFITAINWF